MKKRLSWYTPPVGAGVGYGYAAVSLITALQEQGAQVRYADETLRAFINFVQPVLYMGSPDQFRVGYTPWESTEVPKDWLNTMRGQDEIWTTSSFCKEVFDSYNVNDVVRVVPHGIDSDMWRINDRYVAEKFYFLHVGGPTGRKGGQRVVDAFIELFDGDEDVRLILKSNGSSETRYYASNGAFLPAAAHPQIQVIDRMMNEEELVNLYHSAHCMVYPTNGEGFGLIPFQGIATGMPTICTNATACSDFAELSMPLSAGWIDGVGMHIGQWADPNLEHLRHLMKLAIDDYDDVKEKALHSARIIHDTQRWSNIADQVFDILGDMVYQEI